MTMDMDMKKTALAAAMVLLAGAARADTMGWTEIGVGYDRFDAGDNTTDAFDVRGSLGFGGIGHVSASYLNGSMDSSEGSPSFDFDGYEIRAGVHPSVGENTQVIAEAGYFNYSGDFDTEEDGFVVGFGVRHKMGDQFEVRGQVDYYDGSFDQGTFSEDFNNTSLTVEGRYYWMPTLFTGVAITTGGAEAVSIAGGDDAIRVSVGWSFSGDVM